MSNSREMTGRSLGKVLSVGDIIETEPGYYGKVVDTDKLPRVMVKVLGLSDVYWWVTVPMDDWVNLY